MHVSESKTLLLISDPFHLAFKAKGRKCVTEYSKLENLKQSVFMAFTFAKVGLCLIEEIVA